MPKKERRRERSVPYVQVQTKQDADNYGLSKMGADAAACLHMGSEKICGRKTTYQRFWVKMAITSIEAKKSTTAQQTAPRIR